MGKSYNYERKKLILPEYGRHMHEMVDYLSTIEDREMRNHQAHAVIGVMANINPMLRDANEFEQKLWDHLFIMADFKLDIDSPYPIPTKADLAPKPARLSYPDRKIAIKHYGKNVENILLSLRNAEDIEAVEEIVGNIARYMRTKSYEYNQEHPNNEVIISDIKKMSRNSVSVDEEAINNLKSDYKQPHQQAHGKKNNHQQRQNNKGGQNNNKKNQQQSKGAKQHRNNNNGRK